MESMKTIVISACAISLIIGIIQTIKPSEKYDRQIRIFTACLMLMGILAPLISSVQEITPNWDSTAAAEGYAEELEEESAQQLMMLAEEEVAAVLQQEMAQQAIPCSRLSVKMHIDENESISISSVTVVSTMPERAEAAIRQYFGEEVEIYASENT